LRPRAIELVTCEIDVEMEDTKLIFHMSMKDITLEYLLSFDIEHGLTAPLKETTPWLHQILMSAMQTMCAVKENKHQNVEMYCTVIQLQIANIRSQNNLAFQIIHGLYLFSSGTSRKTIDLLVHCGLSPGYDALHTSHTIMADGQIRRAQLVARGPHMIGWDNIQVSTSTHVEQRTLAPPKVQSGTTAIIYPLRNATLEDLRLRPILDNRLKCDMITFSDNVRPTYMHMHHMTDHLIIDIIKILIDNHPGFNYLLNSPVLKHRSYCPPPLGYKTQEYVLRTTTTDESTTDGNIKVARNVYIDQLVSINQMENFQLAPGLFHAQLNLIWAILHIHRGSLEEIRGLQYYISLLDRVRLGAEHPDYHTLVSLATQVLVGHILLYWEIVSGMSLAALADRKSTAEELKVFASKIYHTYVSAHAVEDVSGQPDPEIQDRVLRNIILLNRDLLIFYKLDLAISSGDFGRVEIFLGTLTMMFAGARCKNYTTELLHFIQNLNKVWTSNFA
ncbi:hypothetical protein BDR06DRAFT_897087, partial [Suillus hirtellus]